MHYPIKKQLRTVEAIITVWYRPGELRAYFKIGMRSDFAKAESISRKTLSFRKQTNFPP
jgi:hypothetical protein